MRNKRKLMDIRNVSIKKLMNEDKFIWEEDHFDVVAFVGVIICIGLSLFLIYHIIIFKRRSRIGFDVFNIIFIFCLANHRD